MTLDIKESIFQGRIYGVDKTTVGVNEEAWHMIRNNITANFLQIGEIVGATLDNMHREWRFDFMIDSKDFHSIPIWLDTDERNLPKGNWHWVDIVGAGNGPLSSVGLGEKAPANSSIQTRIALLLFRHQDKKRRILTVRTKDVNAICWVDLLSPFSETSS